jgi:hypothetical protein
MSVNLKVVLGTVNYTDFLHVTAAKVSSPSTVVWETWIPMPKTSYTFVIPGLDPENYYVSYYESPDDSSLGTLQTQLIVDALTNEVKAERRFYTCGGGGTYDPVEGAMSITDPYLIGKNVTGVFKESFRYYEPGTEFSSDNTVGTVSMLNNVAFALSEKIIIEITYDTGISTTSSSGGGLYTGITTVTEGARTLTTDEINTRIRCLGTGSTQVITVCSLSAISTDKGYYFDNSVGGTAVQVKILFSGTDTLRFNGFNSSSILFSEFWVSRGEHLLIRKFVDDSGTAYWEVIGDYKGVNVGEKVTLGYLSHPNVLPESAGWYDGDEYGRMWWWLNNVLPAIHRYTASSTDPVDSSRAGQFALDPTLKKFRMPDSRYMSEKGLNNFDVQGLPDVLRPVNYPGGFQANQVGQITVAINKGDGYTGHAISTNRMAPGQASNPQPTDYIIVNQGAKNIVDNIGVIYARRI